ncbi:hypothetical protein GGI15_004535 [Coemansia interrupta]|uniref:Ribonucleases P/MRP subunit Pop8-like domain-containing protein n=1 Tax=Coemansia interrupta TaxID=1126814 RepID=A0A9W8H9B8_9FUNG|nr:hypothetical protein GGI15_004535 [Coemansia interrupta]
MVDFNTVRLASTLAPFQTLPYDIIDKIIEYTLCGINPASDKFWRKSYPLLQCCKNWRTAFIQTEFSELTVKLKRTLPLGLSFSKHPYPANPRLYPIEECVRHVVFSVDSWKRLSTGETLKWIRTSYEISRINKAAVSSLRIEGFHGDEWCTYFKKHTDAAITRLEEFLTCLHETFPNLKSVSLNILKWEFLKRIDRDEHRVEKALAPLFRGRAVTMYAKFIKDSFKSFNPRYFIGLVSLSIESTDCSNYHKYSELWIMKVIRLNAPTLRKLHLCIIRDDWLQGMTTSKAGNPITYPKLESITTGAPCFDTNEQRDSAQAYARGEMPEYFRHFPVLQYINLYGRPSETRWAAHAPPMATFKTTITRQPFYYFAVELATNRPSEHTMDATQFHSFLTAALFEWLGVVGSGMSVDIMDYAFPRAVVRVPFAKHRGVWQALTVVTFRLLNGAMARFKVDRGSAFYMGVAASSRTEF